MPPSMTPSIPGVDGMTEEEIAAFLESLDECTPTIPDWLTNHYLKQSGIKEPDVRITRLISLAAQKFVTQIAQDARQCAQQRSEMKAREFENKIKILEALQDELLAEHEVDRAGEEVERWPPRPLD